MFEKIVSNHALWIGITIGGFCLPILAYWAGSRTSSEQMANVGIAFVVISVGLILLTDQLLARMIRPVSSPEQTKTTLN